MADEGLEFQIEDFLREESVAEAEDDSTAQLTDGVDLNEPPPASASTRSKKTKKKRWLAAVVGSTALLAIAIGLGVGIGTMGDKQTSAALSQSYEKGEDDFDAYEEEDCTETSSASSSTSSDEDAEIIYESQSRSGDVDIIKSYRSSDVEIRESNDGTLEWMGVKLGAFSNDMGDRNRRRWRVLTSTGIQRSSTAKSGITMRRDLRGESGELSGRYIVEVREYEGTSSYIDYLEFDNGVMYKLLNLPNDLGDAVPGRSYIVIPDSAIMSISEGTIDMLGVRPILLASDINDENLAPPAIVGQRSVLAVRIQLSDQNFDTGFDPSFVSNKIFGGSGDEYNLKSGLESCSYDQVQIIMSPDRTGVNGVEIMNGVVTITLDNSVNDDEDSILNSATEKLNEEFEVASPNVLANHVMFCLPSAVNSPGAGGGTFYGWRSWYDGGDTCTSPSFAIHEIGHNWALNHANEGCDYNPVSGEILINNGCEYQDKSGSMGTSETNDEGPKRCFNAMNSDILGWYDSKSASIDPSAGAGTNCFPFDLYGVDQFGDDESSTVVVEIETQETSKFYMLFNRLSGINSGTNTGPDNVLIVRSVLETATNTYYSELVAKLDVGEVWSETIQGRDVAVGVDSIGSFPSPALVYLSVDGDTTCSRPTSSSSGKSGKSKSSKTSKSKSSKSKASKCRNTSTYPPSTNIPTFSPTQTSPPSTSLAPTKRPTSDSRSSGASVDDKCEVDGKICKACRRCADKPEKKCRQQSPEQFCKKKGCDLDDCEG